MGVRRLAGAMLVFGAAMAGTGPACAQSASATSFGVMEMRPRVMADLVLDHVGEWRALAAMVLWRGEPGWYRHGQDRRRPADDSLAASRARLRLAEDSAVRAGGRLWGHATPRSVYGVGLDAAAQHIHVLGRAYALPRGDSAVVLVVDRTDGVGGPPVVVATVRIAGALPEGFWRGDLEGMRAGSLELRRRLATHPILGPYLLP